MREFEEKGIEERRFELIARIQNLSELNSTPISQDERKNAEIFFINSRLRNRSAPSPQIHTKSEEENQKIEKNEKSLEEEEEEEDKQLFLFLVSKHKINIENLKENENSSSNSPSTCFFQIILENNCSDSPSFSKKVKKELPDMQIKDLKFLLSKIFNLNNIHNKIIVSKSSVNPLPTPLQNDNFFLSQYNISNNSVITIQDDF